MARARRRFALFGEWSLDGLGADLAYWRAEAEYRGSRRLGQRLVGQFDALAGFSGDDLPVYDWYRLGGVALLPGYHHEELKGAHSLAAAVSLRFRLFGQLQLVAAAARATSSPVARTSPWTACAGERRGSTTRARSAPSPSRWGCGTAARPCDPVGGMELTPIIHEAARPVLVNDPFWANRGWEEGDLAARLRLGWADTVTRVLRKDLMRPGPAGCGGAATTGLSRGVQREALDRLRSRGKRVDSNRRFRLETTARAATSAAARSGARTCSSAGPRRSPGRGPRVRARNSRPEKACVADE